MLRKIKKSYQRILNYQKNKNNRTDLFSFDQLEVILSNVSDGVAVIDKNFNIIAFNQIAANISGYQIEETVGIS